MPQSRRYRIYNEDVIKWAEKFKGEPFHALLTDAPYELKFMGNRWDSSGISFRPETWAALGEHLYPGAFGITFGGSRTAHRIAVAIEDAGFIIHPMIGWVYASGFPKATRIDTQIQPRSKMKKLLNPIANQQPGQKGKGTHGDRNPNLYLYQPTDELAQAWNGHRYGLQALKPALEPIIIFQKPYDGKPVDNILLSGAGALNINATRIPSNSSYIINTWNDNAHPFGNGAGNEFTGRQESARWPANFILDDVVAPVLDKQSGISKDGTASGNSGAMGYHHGRRGSTAEVTYGGEGGASRYFYQVQTQLDDADPFKYFKKASTKERNAGLDEKCDHPTVKPIDLNKYLATLLLPPIDYAPRRLLVPFAGVMSEVIGSLLAGWEYVEAIEIGKHYCELGEKRIRYWLKQK